VCWSIECATLVVSFLDTVYNVAYYALACSYARALVSHNWSKKTDIFVSQCIIQCCYWTVSLCCTPFKIELWFLILILCKCTIWQTFLDQDCDLVVNICTFYGDLFLRSFAVVTIAMMNSGLRRIFKPEWFEFEHRIGRGLSVPLRKYFNFCSPNAGFWCNASAILEV